MYISIYFWRQDLVLLFLLPVGLLWWSARKIVGDIPYWNLWLYVFPLQNQWLCAKFSTYYISTCATRVINAALEKVYSKRSRVTRRRSGEEIKVYDRELRRDEWKKIGTLKFGNTVALCKHVILTYVAIIVVVMKERAANNNRWTTMKFQERVSWKKQVRSIFVPCIQFYCTYGNLA